MKKIIAVILSAVVLTGCGEHWEKTKKNIRSDWGGGLRRHVVVKDLKGETIWEYTGRCYINGTSTAGDVTIMFKSSDGESRKADFIGHGFSISAVEE